MPNSVLRKQSTFAENVTEPMQFASGAGSAGACFESVHEIGARLGVGAHHVNQAAIGSSMFMYMIGTLLTGSAIASQAKNMANRNNDTEESALTIPFWKNSRRGYKKNPQELYECRLHDLNDASEDAYLGRRNHLRTLKSKYETLLKSLKKRGYSRRQRNAIVRYMEHRRLEHESSCSDLSPSDMINTLFDKLATDSFPKALLSTIWKDKKARKKFFPYRHFRSMWERSANQEADLVLGAASDKDKKEFMEQRVREQEALLRDLTPGIFEVAFKKAGYLLGGSNAIINGFTTSIGLSAFLISLGIFPVATVPVFAAFLIGTAVVASLALTAPEVITSSQTYGRLLDKGFATKERRRPMQIAALIALTLGCSIGGAMLAFVATGGAAISVAALVVCLYASSAIYGRYGWNAWEGFKRKLKLGHKAWHSAKTHKLKAAMSAILDLKGNGPWQKSGKYISVGLSIAVAGFSAMIGGYAIATGFPAFLLAVGVTATCPPLALGLFIGVGAISGMIMSTALYVPSVYEKLSLSGKALDDNPRGVGPFQVIGSGLNNIARYGSMFGAGTGIALALGTIAFPPVLPAVAVSAIIISASIFGMGMVAGTLLPMARWIHTKIETKTGVDASFAGLGRGVDILLKKAWGALKSSPQIDNEPRDIVTLPAANSGRDIRESDRVSKNNVIAELVTRTVAEPSDPDGALSSSDSSVNSGCDPDDDNRAVSQPLLACR